MPKNKFQIGEIVVLKSGGPDMAVQREYVHPTTGVVTYYCQWFAGKKLESGEFPPESLKRKQPET